MTLNEWIIKGEVGTSSKTIWAAISGAVAHGEKGYDFDVPHDPSDFRRCLMLVQQCSISKEQLQIVKESFPWWAPQIDAWDDLASLYDQEAPTGKCPKLYDRLKALEDESNRLAGWEQIGPNSWRSGNHVTFSIKI